jgi:hypothetical protein
MASDTLAAFATRAAVIVSATPSSIATQPPKGQHIMGKKDAALHGMSKKERAALEARAAELAAKIAEREARKSAKAKVKAKGKRDAVKKAMRDTPKPSKKLKAKIERAVADYPTAGLDVVEPMTFTGEPEAPIAADPKTGEIVEDRSTPLDADGMKAALDADLDAAIKARVQAKRAAREKAAADLAEVPAKIAAEREKRHARPIVDDLGRLPVVPVSYSDDGFEKVNLPGDYIEPPEPHVAEIVETDHGREIAVGPAVEDFAKPSEAPVRFEDRVNGNGQYKIKTPDDPRKERGYTRVTTYIDCLEDKTMLEKWKARVLLEGVATSEDDVTDRVATITNARDDAIAKARKADRKGKLGVGELAPLIDHAWGDFKRALDALADEVFEIGGGREKATKGTDLHALCDLAESEGIAAVGDKLTAGEITPADLADVEAYLEAIKKLGARPVLAEQVVVNDDLKVAGRLDRVYMVKLPGEARARKRVVDLKTGSVEYGKGKIAQQIELYAGGSAYDEETGERTPLGVDRTLGLLIHLPAGTGRATVHRVDLSLGRKGNRLAGEVRAWRNEGKRAIDLTADVLAEIEKATDLHV